MLERRRFRSHSEVSGRRIRVLGRADDLIKIRGELVDVATLQRALQARVKAGLVRLDIKPDARNGASIHLVVENSHAAAEARGAFDIFPPYAKPASLRVAAVPRTELGKILRG